jgi:hypothetical protein
LCDIIKKAIISILENEAMRKINNRQYKLTQIRQKPASIKPDIRSKKGKRYDSKLDRRSK